MNRLLALLVATTVILASCKQDDMSSEGIVVINTIEELDTIKDNCIGTPLESKEDIEINLLGEWQLIGIQSGWNNEFVKRDISLSIDQNFIVLTDHTTGEVSEKTWELTNVEVNNIKYFYIETNEDAFNNRLGMEFFCQDYMFGSGRVDDGSTYVYAKVR